MRIGIYAGQYYDEETGLHYNYHRYYDPRTGRYLTPDPIGLAGGINLFVYAGNNPLNVIDPFGLENVFFSSIGKGTVVISQAIDKSLNRGIDAVGWNDPELSNSLAKQVRWQVYTGLGQKDLKPLLPSPPSMESMTYEQYLLYGAKAMVETGEPDYTLAGWMTGITPAAAILWLPTAGVLDASTSLMADHLDTTRYEWHYWPPFTAPEPIIDSGPKSCK